MILFCLFSIYPSNTVFFFFFGRRDTTTLREHTEGTLALTLHHKMQIANANGIFFFFFLKQENMRRLDKKIAEAVRLCCKITKQKKKKQPPCEYH